jgi:calcineurin-like phosphoesterase family protein
VSSLSLCVLSDVHAHGAVIDDSYVSRESKYAGEYTNPLVDLQECICQRSLHADYLVIPGDMTHGADISGLLFCWHELQEIAELLGAKLLAIPGNHDIVIKEHQEDIRAHLKDLNPTFPTALSSSIDSFWRDGWMLIEEATHRFLLIDTTYGISSRPYGEAAEKEYDFLVQRGKYSRAMNALIKRKLQGLPEKINIAVLHHHPQEYQSVKELKDTYGAIEGGDLLVDTLSNCTSTGPWFIVHGHKHIPLLTNMKIHTNSGPSVLCSASVGARLWGKIGTITRNQFHIVELFNDLSFNRLCGRVTSFSWAFNFGWYTANTLAAGLPPKCGFGFLGDIRKLAEKIAQDLKNSGLQLIEYRSLLERYPQIDFLLPKDLDDLEYHLNNNGYGFLWNRGSIMQLSKLPVDEADV